MMTMGTSAAATGRRLAETWSRSLDSILDFDSPGRLVQRLMWTMVSVRTHRSAVSMNLHNHHNAFRKPYDRHVVYNRSPKSIVANFPVHKLHSTNRSKLERNQEQNNGGSSVAFSICSFHLLLPFPFLMPHRTAVPVGLLRPGRRCRHSAAPAFRQPSTARSTSLPVQHLRPSGLFSCRPHSLELSPEFHPGPDHQCRLF